MSDDDRKHEGATREIAFTPSRSASPRTTAPPGPAATTPGLQPAVRSGDDAEAATGARWQEDRQRRRDVARLARSLLVHLDTLARLLVTHAAENAAVHAAVRDLQGDLDGLRSLHGDIAMVFAEGHAFVNGVWVRATDRAFEAASLLTEGLAELDGRGLILDKEGGLQGVVGLARLLREARRTSSPAQRKAAARALPGIRLIPISTADAARNPSARARDEALGILKEGIETLSRMELANLDLYLRRRQKALVRQLVELAERSPEELLAITAIRDPSLPTSAHNLMVAIYAIGMGRSMDLTRRDLMRLGVAALNHNLGEAALDEEVFAAPRRLQAQERAAVERHPLAGLSHLLEHYGFGSGTVERALVSAEHHVHWDGSGGYPFHSHARRHLFSRVVAVADVFDALCGERPWRGAYAPDQAVTLLQREGGRQLDPVLMRLLVRLVGRYPPGSVVELDSGEWAVVLGPGAGATPLMRPRVLLIADEDGFEHARPIVVDLGERYPRRRAWLRTIARPRDARTLGLRVARYLLADRVEVPPVTLDHDVAAPGASDGHVP